MFPSTFLDLQQSVIDVGKLDSSYDTQTVKDWINQSYYEVCTETEFYTAGAAATALSANQTSVTVPTPILSVDYVVPTGVSGDVWGPMEMVTFEEILEQRAYSGGVSLTTGAPTRYAFRSSGVPTIEFWPYAAGGEVLTFYGTRLPPAMVADGEYPLIPEPYASNLLQYGPLVMAAEFKRDIFILDYFNQQYDQWMAKFRGFMNTRVGDKTQQFRVGRQLVYPRGNSVDSPYNWS